MATDKFSDAWDIPRNHQLEINLDGLCYDPLPCANFGGADEATPDTSDYFCIGDDGKPYVKGTIDNTTPERATVAIVTRPSEYGLVLEAAKQTRRGVQCYVDGRVAVYCARPFTVDNLLGWYKLDRWDLGSKSLPQLTDAFAVGNVGDGNAGEVNVTFNGTISGIIPVVNVSATQLIGYENTSGNATAAIYQCLDAICKTGVNFCNVAQTRRGECDVWTQLRNNGANFEIWVSTDGGRTYTLDQTITGLGNVVDADCDLVVTDQAPLELCGDSLRLVPNLPAFDSLFAYDGGNAILFDGDALAGGRNGVMVYSESLSEWFIGQPFEATQTTFENQNAIDSDGTIMLTGGDADGVAVGADYQFSLQAGEVGSWTRATLNIAGFSTISDSIQDVNVRDGNMLMVLNNGTDTRVVSSFDGVNWEEVGSFSGVATYARIRRPNAEITYLVLDEVIWVNYNGACECYWKQLQDVTPNTPDHFEVCSNDPTYLHYTY